MSPPARVVVSHPARQHAYQTALAAQRAGTLSTFLTSFFWPEHDPVVRRLADVLPAGLRRAFEGQVKRRSHPALDPARVRCVPYPHAVAYILARLPGFSGAAWRERLMTLADWEFDRLVAHTLRHGPAPDLVHGFEGGCLATLRVARERGSRTVLDVPSAHEYFKVVHRAEGYHGNRRLWAAITRRYRAERCLADYLIVPSGFVARCLIEHGVPAERIVRIPYGVDPERFRPRLRCPEAGRPFRVLFVGQISRRKGVQYLLDAWQRLRLPNSELWLVGGPDSSGAPLLRRYSGSYHWLGNLPHYRVAEVYGACDLFVFPSLAEGSALVVYEALASALPVVTTAEAGSIVRHGIDGFIVPARAVTDLCARIEYLYRQRATGRAMGERGRRQILDRYTWTHYHQRLAAAHAAILTDAPVQTAVDGAVAAPVATGGAP